VNRRRALRITAFGSGVLAIAVVLIVIVMAVTFIRRPLPERGGSVQLPGMTGTATVIRDDRAVPQIYADTPADLFRVQGYVTAQDRFFEMDLRRHVTAGRLSELLGRNADALQADAVVRTLGWRAVAEKELQLTSPATRRYLEAYADGVNDYVRGKSASELSFSYAVLGRANPLDPIEPWTPVDSLAWLKAVAWDLRSNYDEELQRASAIPQIDSVEKVDQLYPSYPYAQHAPIITDQQKGTTNSSLVPRAAVTKKAAGTPKADDLTALLRSQAAQAAFGAADRAVNAVPQLLGHDEGTGSNSWVVSGNLTASGLPLLANDPHLKASMPGVWTQVGLHCRTVSSTCPFDVAGFTFAGLPGVVVGHNARISWGLTNLYPDVTDFYLERIAGDMVEHDGTLEPVTTRTETIKVAGGDPVPITIRSTSHGPVISDVLPAVARAGRSAPLPDEKLRRDTSYAVSLAWTALQPGRAMDALLGLDVATDFTSFRAAALKLDAPAMNVIYADVDGHIGYQAPGRIPVRGPGVKSDVPADGTWPHPGWEASYDWKGYVPPASLPYVEDPADGFIVAANQAVSRAGKPFITGDWDYGYRSERIRELLEQARNSTHRLTVADMRVIQGDTRNAIAAQLVPLLLKTKVDNSFTQEAVDLLKGWDYAERPDSAAAAYFNTVWVTILNLTFGDELPEGFKPDGGDRWFEVVSGLLDDPRNEFWNDSGTPDIIESRDEVLRRALVTARLQLTSSLGKEPSSWRWGRLHRLTLEQEPLGGKGYLGVLHKLVNRGPYEAPGGSSIVDAFSWDASSGNYSVTSAPSMRMIVDLSNLDSSRWVNQTGQSGHPGDSHYDDQIDAWLHTKDYAWPFSAGAIKAAKDEEQTFSGGTGDSG
jgi:penicillin G amidase